MHCKRALETVVGAAAVWQKTGPYGFGQAHPTRGDCVQTESLIAGATDRRAFFLFSFLFFFFFLFGPLGQPFVALSRGVSAINISAQPPGNRTRIGASSRSESETSAFLVAPV